MQFPGEELASIRHTVFKPACLNRTSVFKNQRVHQQLSSSEIAQAASVPNLNKESCFIYYVNADIQLMTDYKSHLHVSVTCN